MKVYSLLGFVDYEGSELVGVFGSVEDVLRCVESGKGSWWYDQMGYVGSELGCGGAGQLYQCPAQWLDAVESLVEYVEFHRGR